MYQAPLDPQLLANTIVSIPGQTISDRANAISALEAQKTTNLLYSMMSRLDSAETDLEQLTQLYEQSNKIQEEHNRILQQQVDELKKQAEALKKENELQAIELHKEKIYKWLSFGISTAIAVLALGVGILGLF